MRIVVVILLVLLIPAVCAEYLVVTMDVTDAGVSVQNIELAFTASIRSTHDSGESVSVEVIDEGWRSVSRARITASLIEVIDGTSVREADADRVRMSAIVPIDERAQLLVVRSGDGGEIFDLRSASCGVAPLCSNCARVYPEWCARVRSSDARFDPALLIAVTLNIIILSTIVVFLMARRKA
jgi:hypothetical protein